MTDDAALARPVESAPGVRRLRLPLPEAPHEVNAWLLEDGPGWMVVDTGLAIPSLQGLWEEVFAHGLEGRPVTRVLVTHFHADHVGLAGWICGRWKVPLLMPRSEWLRTRLLAAEDGNIIMQDFAALHQHAGCPPGLLEHMRRRGLSYLNRVVAPPRSVEAIADGQMLRVGGREWQVLVGAGHTPEMACLWNAADRVLIAADHILPRISPHVGIGPAEPDSDPLGIYLGSLAQFRRLPAGTLVLPSHGEPFHGLHPRIDALLRHHDQRLDFLRADALAAGAAGRTAYEAIPGMFSRPIRPEQLGPAAAETLAHLMCLVHRQELRIARTDGLIRFFAGGASPAG